MNPIKVGLLGIGTVGSGVYNVLSRNQSVIKARAGRGIEIAVVADRNVEHARSVVDASAEVIDDAFAVVQRPDIDIVIELIGGYTIAKDLVLQATRVMLVQGSGFNYHDNQHFRIVFLPQEDALREAIQRLARFLEAYRKRHGAKS